MLKITVRPLDKRNSSMPNRTPLSVEMTISSSTGHPSCAFRFDRPGLMVRDGAARLLTMTTKDRSGKNDLHPEEPAAGGRLERWPQTSGQLILACDGPSSRYPERGRPPHQGRFILQVVET